MLQIEKGQDIKQELLHRYKTILPDELIKIIRQHQQIQITQIRTTIPVLTLILQLLTMVIQLRLRPQMLPC